MLDEQIKDILEDIDCMHKSADVHHVNFLRLRIAMGIKAIAGQNVEPDKGPWTAELRNGMAVIYSDDFTHDVTLRVSGDFYSDGAKLAYANDIARQLNTTKNPKSAWLRVRTEPALDYDEKELDKIVNQYTRNRPALTWKLQRTSTSGIGQNVHVVFSDGYSKDITNVDSW